MRISQSVHVIKRVGPSGQSPSGLAHHREGEYLAVHDAKSADGRGRISSFDINSAVLSPKEVDWSGTNPPVDLEAITRIDGTEDRYLACEGRNRDAQARIFHFRYSDGEIDLLDSQPLPELPEQIEGLATKKREDGSVIVLLGGRGGFNSSPGYLHWARMTPEGMLDWSDQVGLEGLPVEHDHVSAPHQRRISELYLDDESSLWASTCVDNGDDGPFESNIYRVGVVDTRQAVPVRLTVDQFSQPFDKKIEALAAPSKAPWDAIAGSDDESLGGSYMKLSEGPASHSLITVAEHSA